MTGAAEPRAAPQRETPWRANNQHSNAAGLPRTGLLIAKAWALRESLVSSSAPSLTAVATEQGISQSYATRLVRLAWLAPDIVEAILGGCQPTNLTASRLMQDTRTHSPRQVKQIARSIEAFGFNVPVLIDAQSLVIAGHGRVLACQQLGWTEVRIPPVRAAFRRGVEPAF